jgi:hypothetical protein
MSKEPVTTLQAFKNSLNIPLNNRFKVLGGIAKEMAIDDIEEALNFLLKEKLNRIDRLRELKVPLAIMLDSFNYYNQEVKFLIKLSNQKYNAEALQRLRDKENETRN